MTEATRPDPVRTGIIRGIAFYSGIAASWSAILVSLFIVYEIAARYFLRSPSSWVVDFSSYWLVWFSFLTAAYALFKNAHIKVDVLTIRLRPDAASVMHLLSMLGVVVLSAGLSYSGFVITFNSFQSGQATPNILHLPVGYIQLGLLVGSAILLISSLSEVIGLVRTIPRRGLSLRSLMPAIVFMALLALSIRLIYLDFTIPGLLLMLFVLLLGGVPVFASLGITGGVGYIAVYEGLDGLQQLAFVGYQSTNSFTLVALPLFILAGYIIATGGLGEDLFDLIVSFIGHWPGGVMVATIGACAIFAAISGSSVATVATIAPVALPALKRHGYSTRVAVGALAAAGTLGILIPPSGAMILYASITDVSVGSLFLAGVVPGLLLMLMLMAYAVWAHFQQYRAPGELHQRAQATSWSGRWSALKRSVWALLAPVIVLGGIYGGIFTATESAGVILIYALAVSLLRHDFSYKALVKTMADGTNSSSMIFAIVIGAAATGGVFTMLQLPQFAVDYIVAADMSRWAVLVAMVVLIGILGMFLEVVSLLLIITPLLYPLIIHLGFNPIWFGIFLTINMELALITPPVGMNLFVIKQISDEPMELIIKSVLPYLGLFLLFFVLVAVFTDLSLWLPSRALG